MSQCPEPRDREAIRSLITDTVATLLKDTLDFHVHLQIQGLLGITIDKSDVFIIQLDETVTDEKSASATSRYNTPHKNNNTTGRQPPPLKPRPGVSGAQQKFEGSRASMIKNYRQYTPRGQHGGASRGSHGVHCVGNAAVDGAGNMSRYKGGSTSNRFDVKNIKLEQHDGSSIDHEKGEQDEGEGREGRGGDSREMIGEEEGRDEKGFHDSSVNQSQDDVTYVGDNGISPRSSSQSLICMMCNVKCRDRRHLQRHLLNHGTEPSFVCPHCNKTFLWEASLSTHLISHTGQYPHTCSTCGKGCLDKSRLRAHEMRHNGVRQCTKCEEKFATFRELREHKLAKKCTRVKREVDHPYVCATCPKKCRSKEELERHLLKHRDAPFHCSYCDKTFRWAVSVINHELVHTGNFPYTCSLCGKGCVNTASLKAHEMRHGGLRPFPCRECGKRFRTRYNLQQHKLTHRKDDTAANIFDENLTTGPEMTDREYKSHDPKPKMKTIKRRDPNSGIPIFGSGVVAQSKNVCDICNNCFRDRKYLERHMLTHSGDRPFVCRICNKSFLWSASLAKHELLHTGNYQHRCSTCGRGCISASSLRTHELTHTGDRPYPCPECPKSYKTPYSLEEHRQVHSGEKSYQCEHCGKSFQGSASLRRHVKVHESEGTVPLEHELSTVGIDSMGAVSHDHELSSAVPYEYDPTDAISNENMGMGGMVGELGGVSHGYERASARDRMQDCDTGSLTMDVVDMRI